MSDVFQDFVVVVETADGTLHSYKPETFRLAARCSSAVLLSECVKRYNTRMEREGLRERAQIMSRPRKRP